MDGQRAARSWNLGFGSGMLEVGNSVDIHQPPMVGQTRGHRRGTWSWAAVSGEG